MSEEKLKNLIDTYPKYAPIFKAVFTWFVTHPKQIGVSLEFFYNKKYDFSKEEIDIAFFLMKQTSVVKPIYRVLDNDGTRIGKDFESIDEIPEYVDTMWGEKKSKDEVFIVPYYTLTS